MSVLLPAFVDDASSLIDLVQQSSPRGVPPLPVLDFIYPRPLKDYIEGDHCRWGRTVRRYDKIYVVMQRAGFISSGDWDSRCFTHVLDIFSFTRATRGILQLPEFVDHAGGLLDLVAQSIPRIVLYFPSYNQFLLLLE